MALFRNARMSNPGDAERDQADRDRADRKRKRIIRSAHEPLIPFICKVLFFCMTAGTALDLVMELVTYFRREVRPSPAVFGASLGWSLLLIWLFFALPLLILADIQLVRNARGGYRDEVFFFRSECPEGTDYTTFEQVVQPEIDAVRDPELVLYKRDAPYDTRKKYLRYVIISGAGAAVFALLWFICARAAR